MIVTSAGSRQGGGSRNGPTDYSETFLRGDQPFTLGDNWFDCFSKSASVSAGENALQALVNVSVAGATFGGVANAVTRVRFIPIPIDHNAVRAGALVRGQKAAFTFVGSSGASSIDVGPMVFAPVMGGLEYCLNRAASGQVTIYCDLSDASGAGRTLAANVFGMAAGDEGEIRATYAATANTVSWYKNGVLIGSIVDNNGSRPAGGLYGIHYFGNGPGTTATFKNFRGGLI